AAMVERPPSGVQACVTPTALPTRQAHGPTVLARIRAALERAALGRGDLHLGEGALVVAERLLDVHALGPQGRYRLGRHPQFAVDGVTLGVEARGVGRLDRTHAEVDEVSYRLRHRRGDRPTARRTDYYPRLAVFHGHRRRDRVGAGLARLVGVRAPGDRVHQRHAVVPGETGAWHHDADAGGQRVGYRHAVAELVN